MESLRPPLSGSPSSAAISRSQVYSMSTTNPIPQRQIRAVYSQTTITVYQAYSHSIADAALKAGRFMSPFKRDRMTWIKPSLLWMAYRSGWALKPGQERVLAIELTREGFEWALEHSCLSHFEAGTYPDHDAWENRKTISPVRVQWDPERGLRHEPLGYRSLQIGLSGDAVIRYVENWIVNLTDITASMHQLAGLIERGEDAAARALLPNESVYPLTEQLSRILGAG